MGISLTAVFASAGLVGLALALAARETIANFFGGINILIDRPFRTGDYIILDSGERGQVVEVGLRSTRINTRDDVQISIPNSVITDAKIINENVPKNRFRVRIKIGVAYGSDVDQVEGLLLQTAESNQFWLPQCLSPVSDFVPLENLPWNLKRAELLPQHIRPKGPNGSGIGSCPIRIHPFDLSSDPDLGN